MVELDSAAATAVVVNLVVSPYQYTTLTYPDGSGQKEVEESTVYPITIPAGSTAGFVELTASINNRNYYYNYANFTITGSGDAVETAAISMKSGRRGNSNNRTYYYAKQQ